MWCLWGFHQFFPTVHSQLVAVVIPPQLQVISRSCALRAAMASFVPVARAARVVSRDPASRRAPLISRSLVTVGGHALDRLASTDPQAQAQHVAGPLVPAEGQEEYVPMGMEDDGLDDLEEWEQSPSAPAVVDAIGEFNRACQGGARCPFKTGWRPGFQASKPQRRGQERSR